MELPGGGRRDQPLISRPSTPPLPQIGNESLSSHSPHYLFVVAGAKKKKGTWDSASTREVERKLGLCLQALHTSPPLS